ncbi:MAG: acetyl-CoA carboxylase biotin carboxyl carrier protein subunit, partial [Actinocatenispora sp.]
GGLAADGYESVALLAHAPDRVTLEIDGVRREFRVATYPGLVCVDSALGPVALRPEPRFPDAAAEAAPGSLVAPMPGTVARVAVSVGDPVAAGAPLLVLEAMKMEHVVAAPTAGTVTELPVAAGQQVELGTLLAVVAEQDPASGDTPTAD